jgi:hypothetical protein
MQRDSRVHNRQMTMLPTLHLLMVMAVILSPAVDRVRAHPGHEYKVTGTVSRVRIQQLRVEQFEIVQADGAKMLFLANAATDVRNGDARGRDTDLKVGVAVAVEGVENDNGLIEAKLVRILPPKK